MIRRIAFCLALLTPGALPLRAQVGPLSVVDIESLLDLPDSLATVPSEVLAEVRGQLIRESCILFIPNAENIGRLRNAGADEALLEVIRSTCFGGTELVVESAPAGAEVSIDGERVGTTPWTGYYPPGGDVRIAATARGVTQAYPAALPPGRRVRAYFSFPEDTVPLPRVRTNRELIQALGLERQWSPTAPEPTQAQRHAFPGVLTLGILAGGAALGGMHCYEAEGGCMIEPDFADDGEDLNLLSRTFVGAAFGFAGSTVIRLAAGALWNAVDGGLYDRSAARHADWRNQMAIARDNWLLSHPAVDRAIAEETAARSSAEAQNAQVRTRNQALRPSSLTNEALSGSVSR